jgi:ribosomal protein S18 acetylase RimI-like enzyme
MHTYVTKQASRSDLDRMAATTARAFLDDPAFDWLLVNDKRKLERLTKTFEVFTGEQLKCDYVDATTTPDYAGVCVWLGPEHWEPPKRLGPVFGMWGALGTRALGRFFVADAAMKKNHPKQPHWYLSTLAVDPPKQRGGVGRTLLQPGLDRCDEQGLGAYLETQKFENVGYYMGFGFEVEQEITLGRKGPGIWTMWRNPR